jgi:hypothetical protein
VRIMNTQGIPSWLVTGLAILTLMISLFALENPISQLAAQSSNMTGSPILATNGSQSTQPASQIPSTALQSVLEQTQGANATGFAIGNIINQTGLSNTTQVGPDNATMNSVIEEARNTNATSFAAGNIINQTQSSGNSTMG